MQRSFLTLFGESLKMVGGGSLDFQVAHTILTSKLDPKKETPKSAWYEIVSCAVIPLFKINDKKKN